MYDELAKSSSALEMFTRTAAGSTTGAMTTAAAANTKPWTTRAPMLALRNPDPVVGLPTKVILQPTILVRNTTASEVVANITLAWRGDSGKGQVKLPPLNMAPFATQQIQIGPMQKQLGIPDDAHWALVTLTSSTAPNDLIAIASSYDASGRYNLQAPFSPTIAGHFAGGEWRADATHSYIVSVTNSGQKPAETLLSLHYANGAKTYEMQQTIQPGDQMWVNLASLIHDRVPDRKGNILPADLTYGTYDIQQINSISHSLSLGSLAVDQTWGTQIEPPYANCCSQVGAVWDPDEFIFQFGSGGLGYPDIDATDSCNGTLLDISGQFPVWESDNTSVALVSKQKVQAEGVGSAFGTASGELFVGAGGYCAYDPAQAQAPITVQPKISQNSNLWYFNGNPAPSGFTLGSTTATLTASGGGSGTYAWTITAGTSIAALQGTTSGQNVTSVTINSTSYSTSQNDVTVQLQLEPSNGAASVQTTYNLSVDSPYKLISNGSTTNQGVTGSCSIVPAASGTSGFQSLVPYTIISFLGTQITNINVTENFSNIQAVYTNENWPLAAGSATTQTGNFVDNICADGSSLTRLPLTPQSPLSSLQVDQAFQTWNVGSGANSAGLSVQTDTIRRYIDHGLHVAIVSPTR